MTEHHSIATALAHFTAAPMSRKAAMLLVLLIDREIDARFDPAADDDLLAYRQKRAAASPSLALVMELAAMRDGGARLVLEPVALAAEAAAGLSEADYMVSLYNGGTVPRVLIAAGEARHDALTILRAAVEALGAER